MSYSGNDEIRELIGQINETYQKRINEIDALKSNGKASLNEDEIKIKKVPVYLQWVESLKNFITNLAGMIEDMEQKLAETSDSSGNCTNTSLAVVELLQKQQQNQHAEREQVLKKMSEDVNSLHRLVDKMKTLQNSDDIPAADALNELKRYVDELENENEGLFNENDKLRDLFSQIQCQIQQITPPEDGTECKFRTDSDLITELTKENDELKQMIENFRYERQCCSFKLTNTRSSEGDQFRIGQLEEQLMNKDEIIEELRKTIESTPKIPLKECGIEAVIRQEIQDTEKQLKKCQCLANHVKSKAAQTEIVAASRRTSLTNTEESDREKVRLLEEGSKAMASILKDKQDLLRKQESEIKQLADLRAANDQLKHEMGKIELEKIQLADKLNLNESELQKLTDWKENAEMSIKLTFDLRAKQKKKEKYLNKKLHLQNEQIKGLHDERQNLIEKVNSMLTSIGICRREFERFDEVNMQTSEKPALNLNSPS